MILMGVSYKNYQNNFNKNKNNPNQFKSPKSTKKNNRAEEWQDKLIDWITFYRRNIHRFIQHYFGVNLYLYQIIWVYFMSICSKFVTIASRASAKSWLIALLAFAKAVLYPHSEVVVVAETIKQAAIIFGKMSDLKNQYPNIAREINKFSDTQNNCYCELHNTSTIKVVACQESGRGERSTFTIGEEFRIMNKTKFDSIVKPFSYARQTPYLTDPKSPYKDIKVLIEHPQRILISSAYHKCFWWYDETKETIKAMMEGKSAGFIAFDYLLAIKHNIKPKELIAEDRSTMDEITFLEEYENIPWGENADAYFKLDMFKKNRTIKRAFYPQKKNEFDIKKNPYDIRRSSGEIRVMFVDVAAKGGQRNDNTIIGCARLLPTQKGYKIEVVYMESHNGENTIIQSLRVKQIWYDFGAEYIVLDLQNVGVAIFDQLSMVTKDDERGIEYEAMTIMSHDSIPKETYIDCVQRTLSPNALPIIYPINGSAEINNDAARDFKERLRKSLISFLVDEVDAESYLTQKKTKGFIGTVDEVNDKLWYIHPYLQMTLAQNECVSLVLTFVGEKNLIKLKEPSGGRKDRYSALSYLNYFVSFLDKKILRQRNEKNIKEYAKQTASQNPASKIVSPFSNNLSKLQRFGQRR
jgi:hypothetical protein